MNRNEAGACQLLFYGADTFVHQKNTFKDVPLNVSIYVI